MHTLLYDGIIFNYNSDLSGDIMISIFPDTNNNLSLTWKEILTIYNIYKYSYLPYMSCNASHYRDLKLFEWEISKTLKMYAEFEYPFKQDKIILVRKNGDSESAFDTKLHPILYFISVQIKNKIKQTLDSMDDDDILSNIELIESKSFKITKEFYV